MRLTREQLEQIYDWLQQRTIRDTEFPVASPLNGQEHIPIIQDKANKIMNINELISQLPYDFYNITAKQKRDYDCIEDVADDIPVLSRKLGFVVTFRNTVGNWNIYQFTGSSLAQWTHKSCWDNLIKEALKDVIFYPDEEDLTWRQDKDKKLIYFRNRYIDPEEFIGQGFIILRRNIAGSEECFIDDEDHLTNILEQKAINEKNTIYVIQYDFDLAGKSINIPSNSVLWFQGGSINNGSIYCDNTAIWGAYEFSEMGDCKVYGTFNTGQILTFRNNEYKKKEGGYFQTTREIQTMAVSPDVIEEFYGENPEAYKESERQELRWWNGEEWVLILDVTDYNEIKSIVQDLIEKHNKEMAACYKYFKDRCTVIEGRLDDAEERISDCEDRLTKVEEKATDLEDRVDDLERRMDSAEYDIDNLEDWKNNTVDPTLKDHEDRISKAERDIDFLEQWRDEVVNPKLEDHETRIGNVESTVTDHEERITNNEEKVKELEQTVGEHNEWITKTETTLNEIQENNSSFNDTLTSINSSIEDILKSIEEINNTLQNLEDTIISAIEDYLSSHVVGAKSVTVNSTKYDMDDKGNITIPDYPVIPDHVTSADSAISSETSKESEHSQKADYAENAKNAESSSEADHASSADFATSAGTADNANHASSSDNASNADHATTADNAETANKVGHTLTFTGASTGNFDGSADLTINIPEGSSGSTDGGTADKVAHKLKFTGAVTAEYDGSEEVTVNIPNVKEEVAKDEIISTIQKYLNRKVEYWTSKIGTFRSHYISKDSISCLSEKYFGFSSGISDIEKQDEAVDKYIVLGKTQEEINLYETGFSRSWLSESRAELGVVYSSDENFINNLTFSDFQGLGTNTANKGKLVNKTYSTGQESVDGSIKTESAFLSTEFNAILDNKTKYFRSYIYIPTRDAFYMATDYDSIKARRINNTLAPVNEYYFSSVGYEKENRSCIIESEVFNPSNKTVTITVTINNLYISEETPIGLYSCAAGGNYPIKSDAGVPFINTASIKFTKEGVTVSSLSQNRYKYVIDLEKAFGRLSASNYIFCIDLVYKYNPNNESSYDAFFHSSLTIYYIGIPDNTIKILERSDYSN